MAGRVSAGWCELRLKSEWFGFVVGVASPEHVRGKERPGSVVDLASINLDYEEEASRKPHTCFACCL